MLICNLFTTFRERSSSFASTLADAVSPRFAASLIDFFTLTSSAWMCRTCRSSLRPSPRSSAFHLRICSFGSAGFAHGTHMPDIARRSLERNWQTRCRGGGRSSGASAKDLSLRKRDGSHPDFQPPRIGPRGGRESLRGVEHEPREPAGELGARGAARWREQVRCPTRRPTAARRVARVWLSAALPAEQPSCPAVHAVAPCIRVCFGVRAHRVVFEKDKKVENAGRFVIEREDHTLGNLVRMQLLDDPRVDFAGYRMPHPLEHKIHIQVHTTANSNPADAMISACNNLIDKFNRLEEKLDAEVARKQHQNMY